MAGVPGEFGGRLVHVQDTVAEDSKGWFGIDPATILHPDVVAGTVAGRTLNIGGMFVSVTAVVMASGSLCHSLKINK